MPFLLLKLAVGALGGLTAGIAVFTVKRRSAPLARVVQ
jgi:hypothetical protein